MSEDNVKSISIAHINPRIDGMSAIEIMREIKELRIRYRNGDKSVAARGMELRKKLLAIAKTFKNENTTN